MLNLRFAVSVFSVYLLGLGAGVVSSQDYPIKPIRILTGTAASASDFASRIIAQGLTGNWGQQVIVDNRAIIFATETVAKAAPDGYTLLYTASTLWILPLIRNNVSYDPVKDFAPISLAVSTPNILVVHPSVAANNVKGLIALAKAKPGELNYASGGAGASNHLAAELFKAMAGVNMVRVNYKGAGPAVNALVGGQVQVMFATASGVAPHIKSGRLRALAVSSAKPAAAYPNLPTIAAAGLPGYESAQTSGLFAPAKTSGPIIRRLNQEIVRILNHADVKEK